MKETYKTITVGIPAHNEEHNITNLLRSILLQKEISIKISKIIVNCDGCTDNTAEFVRAFTKKYKKIVLLNDKKRKGKAARVNELFRLNKSDILVCVDADVVLSKSCLAELIKPLDDKNVSLVGGCDIPQNGNSFAEKVSVSWITHWQSLVRPLHNFDNPTNCPGRIYALRKDFSKSFLIPVDIVADDHYVYFMAKRMRLKFKYAAKAIVFFKPPLTVIDFINQSLRFSKSGVDIKKHFGSIATQGFSEIDTVSKIVIYLQSFVASPVYFSVAVILQVYIHFLHNFPNKTYSKGMWESIAK